MKLLVFGAGGQIGHEVCRAAWPPSFEVRPLDRKACDITKPSEVSAVIARERPHLIINLAAYTAVDRAERASEVAWAVNCAGAAHIASVCGETTTAIVQLSTDYVFDGAKPGPYCEDDAVNPLSVYGYSKEAGERAVRAATPRHIILRTAWVYGAHGTNFVKTMLRLGAEQSVLRVVADQRGCPTAAADIAAALAVIAAAVDRGKAQWGTFHFTGTGSTSWHGFAEKIIETAARLGAWAAGSKPRVEAITTAEYPTPARRPMNSVLDCRKIATAYGISAPRWQESVTAVVQEVLDQNREAIASIR